MLTLPCRVISCSGSLAGFPDLFREPSPPSPLIWTLPELFSNAFCTERSQTGHTYNLPTHFHIVWCQIKQRGELLRLIVSNLDLIELQIVVMTIYTAA
jgi:hypothetical protein